MRIKKNIVYELYGFVKHWQLSLMLLPTLVLVIIFNYVPMGFLTIAFKNYNLGKGVWGSEWVGLKYFKMIFTTPDLFHLIRNTVVISSLYLLFSFPGAIILALLVNELRHSIFKRFVQTVSYLPHFFPWTIIAGMVLFLFSIDGVFNELFFSWGWKPIQFLTDSTHFIQLIISLNIWKEIGWGTIIYLAAMSGINPSLYEAAIVDGASRFQRIWHITLPGLRPAVGIQFIFAASSLLSVNFDEIYNLYNPQVYNVADVIDTYVVREGVMGLQYSLSSALGLFKGLVGLGLIIMANYFVRRVAEKENALF